jgi:hypothetical protein
MIKPEIPFNNLFYQTIAINKAYMIAISQTAANKKTQTDCQGPNVNRPPASLRPLRLII